MPDERNSTKTRAPTLQFEDAKGLDYQGSQAAYDGLLRKWCPHTQSLILGSKPVDRQSFQTLVALKGSDLLLVNRVVCNVSRATFTACCNADRNKGYIRLDESNVMGHGLSCRLPQNLPKRYRYPEE